MSDSYAKVFTDARFYMDGGSLAAALAVDGQGRIAAVARDEKEAAALTARAIERVGLGGRFVVPAFEDCHNHPAARARTLFELDLRGLDLSWPAAKKRITERLGNTAAQGWVVCHGWDETAWAVTQEELDGLSTAHGIFLVNITYHGGLVNTAGAALLATAGVEVGARGLISESAFEDAVIATAPDADGYYRAIPKFQERLLGLGIVAVHDMHILMSEQLEAYVRLDADGKLPLRTLGYVNERLLADPAKIEPFLRRSGARFSVAGVKLFLDGAIGTRTAALTRPYQDSDGSGILRMTDEECAAAIRAAASLGLRHVAMHCIGDAATAQAVRILSQYREEYAKDINVWRLEHFEMPSAETLEAAREHGAIASMQPNFSWDAMHYEARLGDRVRELNPLRKVLDAGISLAFGSDDMPSGPLEGIEWATRAAPFDSQRISFDEALRAYTRGSHPIEGAAASRDSFAVGSEANFAVLTDDPQTNPAAVESVWIKGERHVAEREA